MQGMKGRGESRTSVAVFSRNQKPSFPSQANLEKKCPTRCQWGRPPSGNGQRQILATSQRKGQRVLLKSQRDGQRKGESGWACAHRSQNDLRIRTAQTHARTPVRMRVHTTPHVAFPVLGDTAGYNDIEDESDNRNSMAWGRYTREENGESSLKRNINK